jgi:hypothetical protein
MKLSVMMENKWPNIEEELLYHYQGENDSLSDDAQEILKSIKFIDSDNNITGLGKQYLDSKFIYENKEHKTILKNEILNITEIRELCQSFYGQKTDRENVELFFKSKTDVSDEAEVGRILGLLNSVDIVSYSKRHGTVQFKETEKVEERDRESYRITHRTPYSNLVRFRKALRSCKGDLFWIDPHFTKKGLEPLAEEVTGDDFDSLRILCGPAHVATHMRDDFKRFQEEMENRDIEADLRVITSEEKLRNLHDRWILSSEGASWNVPPINSLYGNQEAEIHKTEDDIDFDDWWDSAKDIMQDWNSIQPHIN